jgi:adenylate cyclase
MILKLRSRKVIRSLLVIEAVFVTLLFGIALCVRVPWNTLDYQATDIFYRYAMEHGKGAPVSDRIVYLTISDKTYASLHSNVLSRRMLAEMNNNLAKLQPESVMYDLIFAHPGNASEDSIFAQSIANLGVAYLPGAFALGTEPRRFKWEEGDFFTRLKNEYGKKITTTGNGKPYYAANCLSQFDPFAKNAFKSGHISSLPDADGTHRHFALIIKIDSLYFPTPTLQMFLDYNRVPFEDIKVQWGEALTIPAEGMLDKEVRIPIDENGKIYIPYPVTWEKIPRMIEVQNFNAKCKEEKYSNELSEYFSGNFVFVGDVSTGISDLGNTTVEKGVPLVAIHAALMNAYLTNTFYTQETNFHLFISLLVVAFFIFISVIPGNNAYLYLMDILLTIALVIFTYSEMLSFRLFPVVSAIAGVQVVFASVLVLIQVIAAKDQKFIKGAFSKYVPKKVVDSLLENPGSLKLGGEEKVLSVIFTDIQGFTTISEKLPPTELVPLLNEYLTEMTGIVLDNGGIIDKFLGDGIVAEFGAPLPLPHHADAAVDTGMRMLKRLEELCVVWKEKGVPQLKCRVGINSGSVIVGNMGSSQVFDYTVIGDTVNLAARLESANKQYGTYFMVSQSTYEMLTPGKYRARVLDIIKVKGKTLPVKVYNIIGYMSDDIPQETIDYCAHYEKGFESYLAKNFDAAEEKFKSALSLMPEDKAAKEMLRRISFFTKNGIPDDWDGSMTLTEK